MHGQVPRGERPVVVNFDETSIRLYQKTGPGYIVECARKQKRSGKSLSQNVTKGVLRSSFTHVAMICDDDELQPHLPQCVFVNSNQISQEAFNKIQAQLLPNVRAYRVANAWMTNDKMKLVLKELANELKPHLTGRRVLLCGDCYKAHIGKNIWAAAAAHGFFYFIVPPKLTWALQPCDTHLFALFKNKLATGCQRLTILSGSHRLDTESLLAALNETIDDALNKRSWRKAFDDLGYRGDQRRISDRLLSKLEFKERPQIGKNMPDLADLIACFPQRTDIPIGHMFSAVAKVNRCKTDITNDHSAAVASLDLHAQLRDCSSCSRQAQLSDGAATGVPGVRQEDEPPSQTESHPRANVPLLARLPSQRRIHSQPSPAQKMPPPLPPPPPENRRREAYPGHRRCAFQNDVREGG